MTRTENKGVLITGAAGGIGKALVSGFLEMGWRVAGIDQKTLSPFSKEVPYFQGDVTDEGFLETVFKEIKSKFSSVDVLVNNAAIQKCGPLVDMPNEDWDLTMNTNLRSVFLCIRHCYPLLKKPGGAIVNIGSVHAIATSNNIAAYAATKGALLSLTRSLAVELGKEGIRVNAVLPGAIDTEMLRKSLSHRRLRGEASKDETRALGSRVLLGRVGTPEEVAKAVLFLADSEWSSYVTGQSLVVDGGALAQLSTE